MTTSNKTRVMFGTRRGIEAMEPPLLDMRLSSVPRDSERVAIGERSYLILEVYWIIKEDNLTAVVVLEEIVEEEA